MKRFPKLLLLLLFLAWKPLLADDSLGVVRTATLYHFWDQPEDIVVSGDYAYIAVREAGIRIVDLADREAPQTISLYDTPGTAHQLSLFGSTLFVADGPAGMRILDVGNPYEVAEIGALTTLENCTTVEAWQYHAYVGDYANGVSIVDLDDITNPVIISSDTLARTPVELTLRGNYLYVLTERNGFHIIDLSDPFNPVNVGGTDLYSIGASMEIYSHYAFIASNWIGLRPINIENVFDPFYVEIIDYEPIFALDLALSGSRLMATNRDRSFKIIDISNPEDPLLENSIELDYAATCIWANDTLSCLGLQTSVEDGGGMQILDITDPVSPVIQGSIISEGRAMDMDLTDGYAYLAAGTSGLRIVDWRDSNFPVEIQRLELEGFASKILVRDTLAFVLTEPTDDGESGGLNIIDISQPGEAVLLGNERTPVDLVDFAVSGNYGYLAALNFGTMIVDLGVLSSPQIIGTIPGTSIAMSLAIRDTLLYVADYFLGIQVMNIADPHFAEQIMTMETDVPVTMVRIRDDILFALVNQSRFNIYQFSDPLAVDLISSTELEGAITDFEVQGDFAILGTGNPAGYMGESMNGIRILDISEPAEPLLTGWYTTSGNLGGIDLEQQTAAVADYYHLVFLDCSEALGLLDINERSPARLPAKPVLEIYPNPFNSEANLRIQLANDGVLRIGIYNLLGQRIVGQSSRLRAGTHTLNLELQQGQQVMLPSGVYFLEATFNQRPLANRRVVRVN